VKAAQQRLKRSRLRQSRSKRAGLIWIALAAVLLLMLVAWLDFKAPPRTLELSGESEADTRNFQLNDSIYALSAELSSTCQYTFYLTPAGKLWPKDGKAIASASGETSLKERVRPFSPGQYFVHAFTAPEEGCSWKLHLQPD
jgi:hypothetical protein